jgi:hypothetical protein
VFLDVSFLELCIWALFLAFGSWALLLAILEVLGCLDNRRPLRGLRLSCFVARRKFVPGYFKDVSGRGSRWWVRIYFLSKRDGGQVTGGLTMLLIYSEPGTGRSGTILKESIGFSKNIKKSSTLIAGNKGLLFSSRFSLIVLLVIKDI